MAEEAIVEEVAEEVTTKRDKRDMTARLTGDWGWKMKKMLRRRESKDILIINNNHIFENPS